jgi:hypothetical protein
MNRKDQWEVGTNVVERPQHVAQQTRVVHERRPVQGDQAELGVESEVSTNR